MYRRLMQIVAVLCLCAPTALVAQDSRLNGIWVAPVTRGDGAGFLVFTFKVDGSSFTGGKSLNGGRLEPFSDCKIEDGRISFSLPKITGYQQKGLSSVERYTGFLKDDRHLELDGEASFNGINILRRPGSKASANTLDGEWAQQGNPDPQTYYVFHVQGNRLTGEFHTHLGIPDSSGGVLVDDPRTLPFTEGTVHGNEFSFRYMNQWHAPMQFTGTLAEDHLVVNSAVKWPLHAVRIADSSAGFVAAPPNLERGKMGQYRALARLTMEALKRNDLPTVGTL